MRYKQLTPDERYQIKVLKDAGKCNAEIARTLGRNRSTIKREIERNSGERGYRPKQAQEMSDTRRREAKKAIKFDDDVRGYVRERIVEQWSPEQISGRMVLGMGRGISHERIYQFLIEDERKGGSLWSDLRRSKRKRRKRYGSHDRRGQIPNRIGIEMRPAVVDNRIRFGDWEGDTVIGANHKGVLVTLVERRSKYTLIASARTKSEHDVTAAIIRMAASYRDLFTTLTLDNGKEFSGHEKISDALGVDVYFARPYHSWERGLNENTNGLIRQYFPKKTSLLGIDCEAVKTVQDLLNHRPRKSLGYLTPHEVLVEGKPFSI